MRGFANAVSSAAIVIKSQNAIKQKCMEYNEIIF